MSRFLALTLGSFVLTLALAVSGCGESDSFMPPPPPELAGPTVEPTVKVVEMVLPSDPTFEREALAQLVRVVASRGRSSFRLSIPEASAPAQRQAELIRNAADRGASVLIVEPMPDPAVTKALVEVRAKGVPAVVLGDVASEPDKPFPTVRAAPLLESAAKLVEAAAEDATAAKIPADRTAVVLSVRTPQSDLKAYGEALEAAARKAGLTVSELLTFDGKSEGAQKALRERLDSDPKLGIVLTVEDVGMAAALDVRDKLEGKRAFIVAGFARDLGQLADVASVQAAAVAARDLPAIAQEAYNAAIGLVDGETVPEQSVVPDQVRRFSSKYIDQPADPLGGPPKE